MDGFDAASRGRRNALRSYWVSTACGWGRLLYLPVQPDIPARPDRAAVRLLHTVSDPVDQQQRRATSISGNGGGAVDRSSNLSDADGLDEQLALAARAKLRPQRKPV